MTHKSQSVNAPQASAPGVCRLPVPLLRVRHEVAERGSAALKGVGRPQAERCLAALWHNVTRHVSLQDPKHKQ